MEQRYYTPREVADQLRVSPTTVMKLIHDGRLYAVRVSERIYRVPVGAVRKLHSGDHQTYEPTQESVEAAWRKVGGVCKINRVAVEKPYIRDLLYIRGILKNRVGLQAFGAHVTS